MKKALVLLVTALITACGGNQSLVEQVIQQEMDKVTAAEGAIKTPIYFNTANNPHMRQHYIVEAIGRVGVGPCHRFDGDGDWRYNGHTVQPIYMFKHIYNNGSLAYLVLASRKDIVEFIKHNNCYTAAFEMASSEPSSRSVTQVNKEDIQARAPRYLDRLDGKIDGKYTPRYTGKDVVIYVIDRFVDNTPVHPELQGRFKMLGDTTAQHLTTTRAISGCLHHGVAVASVAAGKTLGVAPDAEVRAVKALSCEVSDSAAVSSGGSVIAAIDMILEDYRTGRVYRNDTREAVVNISLALHMLHGVKPYERALRALAQYGLPVVISQGNNAAADSCGIASGGYFPNVISPSGVQATDNGYEVISSFTRGQCTAMFTEAHDNYLASFDADGNPTYRIAGGTSYAAPQVAGAIAAYLESRRGGFTPAWDELIRDITKVEDIKGDLKGAPNLILSTNWNMVE